MQSTIKPPWSLRPTEDWAYLDWITGIIRVNADAHDYDATRRKFESGDPSTLSSRDALILETLTHETTHLMQICTTGLMYAIARQVSDAVREYVRELNPQRYEDLPEKVPPKVIARIDQFRRLLDQNGREGLTVRTIAESTAFLTQKRTHWDGIAPTDYATMIAGQAPEYRAAYDVAVDRLGPDEAFKMCPLLSAFALCYWQAVDMYVALCERAAAELAAGTFRTRNLLEFRDDVASAIGATDLGIPDPDSHGNHLVYAPIVRELRRLNLADQFSYLQYWSRPHALDSLTVIDLVCPPMMFNPRADGRAVLFVTRRFGPNATSSDEPPGPISDEMGTLILLHEISTRVWYS